MDEDALVLFHVAQLVRLDFMLILVVIVSRHVAAGISPTPFCDLSRSQEIRAVNGTRLVGSFENYSLSQIEGHDFRFIIAYTKNQSCHDSTQTPGIHVG
jgi:hypothetical protein